MALSISIVMTVLNRVREVGEAIESALMQEPVPEIVVVDGGSTDGTRERVSTLPQVRIIDAPGSSIYQGLNIGIHAARGDLIGILHSDDRLPPGALTMVLEGAARNPSAAIIRGRAAFRDMAKEGTLRPLSDMERAVAHELTVRGITFGAPAFNACFVRSETYRSLGLFDESLTIAADREWLLRALLKGTAVALVDGTVYEYRAHEGSLTIGAGRRAEACYAQEHLAIVARYLPSLPRGDGRRTLLSWHAQEMVRLIARSRNARLLAMEAHSAFRLSPYWPFLAVGAMLALARRRLPVSLNSPSSIRDSSAHRLPVGP